jgi:hypothetical protein
MTDPERCARAMRTTRVHRLPKLLALALSAAGGTALVVAAIALMGLLVWLVMKL